MTAGRRTQQFGSHAAVTSAGSELLRRGEGRRGRLCSAYSLVTKDGDHAEHDDDRDGERRDRPAHEPLAARRSAEGSRADRARAGRALRPLRPARRGADRCGLRRVRARPPGPRRHCQRRRPRLLRRPGRLGHGRRGPSGRHPVRAGGEPRAAGLPPRALDGVVPGPLLRHREQPRPRGPRALGHRWRPRLAGEGRAARGQDRGAAARRTAREHAPAGLLNGPYNGAFKPNRTPFDWLSRDEAEVDKYVADELCGRTATSSFFVDLGGGRGPVQRPTPGGPGATRPPGPHRLG